MFTTDHSFVCVAHFLFLRYVRIRNQRAVVASRSAIHLPFLISHRVELYLLDYGTWNLFFLYFWPKDLNNLKVLLNFVEYF